MYLKPKRLKPKLFKMLNRIQVKLKAKLKNYRALIA